MLNPGNITYFFLLWKTLSKGEKMPFLKKLNLNLIESLKKTFPDLSFKTEEQTRTGIALSLDLF